MRVENTSYSDTIVVRIQQMGTPFETTVEVPNGATVAEIKAKAWLASGTEVRWNGQLIPDTARPENWELLVVQTSKYTQG